MYFDEEDAVDTRAFEIDPEPEDDLPLDPPKPKVVKKAKKEVEPLGSFIQRLMEPTKVLRTAMLNRTKHLGLSFKPQGQYSCIIHTDPFTNKIKRLTGLHNAMCEHIFPRNVRKHPTQPNFLQCSSPERGKLLDAAREHYVDHVSDDQCSCAIKPNLSQENEDLMRAFYEDAVRLELLPVTAQLICFDEETGVGTMADDIFYSTRLGGLVVVECKSGYAGAIQKPISSSCENLKKGPFATIKPYVTHSWLNRHMTQAALTALMTQANYCTEKMPLVAVYVCYIDRTPQFEEELKGMKMFWAEVTAESWFCKPEDRVAFFEEWKQIVTLKPTKEIPEVKEKKNSQDLGEDIGLTTSDWDNFNDDDDDDDDYYDKPKKEYRKNKEPAQRKRSFMDETLFSHM